MKTVWKSRFKLFIGWMTLFVIGTDLFVVSPLLPLIAKNFHISSVQAGWLVTVFSMAYVIGAPVLGTLSDRVIRKKLIFAGLVCFAISNILTGLSPSFLWLVISRMLAGLSAAAVTPSTYAITGDEATENRRGAWLSIVGSGLLTALWAGAPIGLFIGTSYGWKTVFIILSVISMMTAFLNLIAWSKITKKLTAKQAKKKTSYANLATLLAATRSTVLWGVAVYGLYTYLGTGLQSFAYPSAKIEAAIAVYGIGAVLGGINGGTLADKFGAKKVDTVSLICIGLSLIFISISLSFTYLLFSALVLFAFLGYAFFPAHQTRLVQNYPDQRGTFMAWNNSALYIGIALGSIMGGWVMSEWDFRILPLVCAGIAFFGSALSTLSLKKI
ncbi:MFS transporter [Sporolactobacillus putidus]|uniref:MFS transporter n=1 Tax=Sporolactobacillus putidus TaxID=492735 RepID=A0A917S891_9BACL|nr:MFS transporter [Sporolactobacillus putidus]GGL61954.1 MFS transporter [Sporolactobacillus putidus]